MKKSLLIFTRVLVALVFVVSAAAKFLSIDAFEVYLFRASHLDFDVAAVFSRLLIGFEFLIGILLMFRLRFWLAWWTAVAFIALFSAFLVNQVFAGADENCFCMGELVEFSATESLIKNAGLLLLLLMLRKTQSYRLGQKWILPAIFVVAAAVPFIASPPDVFVQGRFTQAEHDQLSLDAAIEEEKIPAEFVEGKKLLAFYSTGCRFCKMASTRIATVVEKADIAPSQVNIVFWGGNEGKATRFFDETHSPNLDFVGMETKSYLDITKGRMPLILLIEEGRVVDKMNYRTLDEDVIEHFLKEE